MLISYGPLQIEVYFLQYNPPIPGWYMPPHFHEQYEFHFIITGKGEMNIRSERLNLFAGLVYMAPPNEIHEQFSDTEDPMEFFHTTLSITGLSKNLPRIYKPLPLVQDKLKNIHNLQRKFGLKNMFDIQSQLLQILWDIISPVLEKEKYSYFNENEGFKTNSSNTHQIIDNAINYILLNKLDNPKISQIARHCHISAQQLSDLFFQSMHTTIYEFIQHERYLWASSELLRTHKTIDEISKDLKFNSKQYFCHWFKKYSSKSPLLYRNEKAHEYYY